MEEHGKLESVVKARLMMMNQQLGRRVYYKNLIIRCLKIEISKFYNSSLLL